MEENKDTKKQFRFAARDTQNLKLATDELRLTTGISAWSEAETVRYLLDEYVIENKLRKG